ncbi:M3 family oligoendopeptidase [Desulfopila aestuarii]|uniref:Oligoendopeptidase F n=1 Tax=Desulfopila aestuarii DSM 18488 TaxID=1121416 RepID=A0A1M7YKJ7_9BACT|nr:M3 family oligoendopeptidase [Desulfopila aestuarii]SHO53141.1 oligoendopeptidase F [Desulfopila aestuarii DSM 18488]
MTETTSINETLSTTEVLWQLEDLYITGDVSQLEQDMARASEEAAAIRSEYYQKVTSLSPEDLFRLVNRLERLDCSLGKLATYAFLNFTTQVNNAEAGALNQRIRELVSQCGKETVFFELEWNRINDEQAGAILKSPILASYSHYLRSMRRYLPHQLPESEEKLLLETQPVGRRSWTTLFEKVFGHLKFGPTGRSEEEVLTDLYHNDHEIRKTAAAELTEGLKSQNHILTHIFNTLAADKMISDRIRNYESWIGSMNLGNQLHDATVASLVTAVTSRYDLVQRYYRVKRELLGLGELYDYDRYAPLPSLPSTKIDWPTCQKTVLESFTDFSQEMADIAGDFFTKRWIHAPVTPGKRGGAFAHPCVPEVHPYVLVNYTGTLRDVSTVAHELGHGVHQVLAARKGYYNSDTPLVLAETASVFAELLVFNSQLELIRSEAEKRAFICQKLESIFATIFRQTAMNRFEDAMHNGRREKGELSSEALGEYWLTTQRQMFGDSVTLTDDYGTWWSYIPHFLNTPGYVYSYAFGELLVLALYKIYQQEGKGFIQKYLTLLAAGGSDTPYELVKPFGIDLDSPAFWHQGLDVIEEMVGQIE